VKRFFVSLGRLDKVKAKDFVGSITANTSITGNEIGKIDIMDKFSFVEIPGEYEHKFVKIMNGKTIKGKEVRVELANKK
jgi:ATP-dependent RNA helicase DeaD